jgi:hypothetical protein
MGLFVQPCKCLIWVPFGLPFRFVPPTKFRCPPWHQDPLALLPSPFFLLRNSKRGCSTCKHVLEIKRWLCGFWYHLSIFHPKTFIFASLFPTPFCIFQNQFNVLHLTMMGIFNILLGPGSLECLMCLLIYWHMVLPIFNGAYGWFPQRSLF